MRTAGIVFVLGTVAGAVAQTAGPSTTPVKPAPRPVPRAVPVRPGQGTQLNPPNTKAHPVVTPPPFAKIRPAAGTKPAPAKTNGKAAVKPSPAKPAPGSKGAALLVPKDAKQVDASTWRWTDPQGAVWIYRKTPFGINHYKESEEALRAGGPAATGVPADAKAIDGSTWRAVDSKGTAWIYKRTPFGMNKYREQDAEQRDRAQVVENPARITDQGDSYKFERSTPFGVETWVRKKDALTEGDKEMLKESQGMAALTSKGKP